MRNHRDSDERLKGIAERESERHPYARELVDAFLPLIAAREAFCGQAPLHERPPVALARERFLAGVPLMAQQPLFLPDDPWQEMLNAVVTAMEKGFPALQDDLGKLTAAIAGGAVSPCDALAVDGEEAERIMGRWARQFSVAPGTLAFVLEQLKRLALHRRRQALAAIVAGIPWQKGYCPLCGALPSLAWIREKGGERRLHCGQCGHEWAFSRVICPACEAEEPEGMPFFFVAGHEREAAFACDRCKKYLLTLHQVADWDGRDPDLAAIGMAHLDLLMQEKGFAPMTACGWNIFSKET